MTLFDGLAALLPGDFNLGYKPFSKQMFEKIEKNKKLFLKVSKIFNDFMEGSHPQEKNIDIMVAFLNTIKSNNINLYKEFRIEVISCYLNSQEHYQKNITPIRLGSLKEIKENDYSILEPVFERGKILRNVRSVKE